MFSLTSPRGQAEESDSWSDGSVSLDFVDVNKRSSSIAAVFVSENDRLPTSSKVFSDVASNGPSSVSAPRKNVLGSTGIPALDHRSPSNGGCLTERGSIISTAAPEVSPHSSFHSQSGSCAASIDQTHVDRIQSSVNRSLHETSHDAVLTDQIPPPDDMQSVMNGSSHATPYGGNSGSDSFKVEVSTAHSRSSCDSSSCNGSLDEGHTEAASMEKCSASNSSSGRSELAPKIVEAPVPSSCEPDATHRRLSRSVDLHVRYRLDSSTDSLQLPEHRSQEDDPVPGEISHGSTAAPPGDYATVTMMTSDRHRQDSLPSVSRRSSSAADLNLARESHPPASVNSSTSSPVAYQDITRESHRPASINSSTSSPVGDQDITRELHRSTTVNNQQVRLRSTITEHENGVLSQNERNGVVGDSAIAREMTIPTNREARATALRPSPRRNIINSGIILAQLVDDRSPENMRKLAPLPLPAIGKHDKHEGVPPHNTSHGSLSRQSVVSIPEEGERDRSRSKSHSDLSGTGGNVLFPEHTARELLPAISLSSVSSAGSSKQQKTRFKRLARMKKALIGPLKRLRRQSSQDGSSMSSCPADSQSGVHPVRTDGLLSHATHKTLRTTSSSVVHSSFPTAEGEVRYGEVSADVEARYDEASAGIQARCGEFSAEGEARHEVFADVEARYCEVPADVEVRYDEVSLGMEARYGEVSAGIESPCDDVPVDVQARSGEVSAERTDNPLLGEIGESSTSNGVCTVYQADVSYETAGASIAKRSNVPRTEDSSPSELPGRGERSRPRERETSGRVYTIEEGALRKLVRLASQSEGAMLESVQQHQKRRVELGQPTEYQLESPVSSSGRGVDTRRAESGGPRGNSVLYSPAAGDEESVSVTNDPDDQVLCSPSAGGDKDTISVTNDPNDQVLCSPSAGGDKGNVSVTNAPDVQVLYPPSAGGDKNTMCATTPAPVDSAMYRQISTLPSSFVLQQSLIKQLKSDLKQLTEGTTDQLLSIDGQLMCMAALVRRVSVPGCTTSGFGESRHFPKDENQREEDLQLLGGRGAISATVNTSSDPSSTRLTHIPVTDKETDPRYSFSRDSRIDRVLVDQFALEGEPSERAGLAKTQLSQPVDVHIQQAGDKECVDKHLQDPAVSDKQLQDAVVEKQLQDPVASNKQLQYLVVSDKQLQDSTVSDKQLQDPVVSDKQLQDPVVSDKQLQDPVVSDKQLQDSIVSDKQLQDPIVSDKQLQDPIVSDKQLQDPIVSNKQLEDPVVSNTQLQDAVVEKQLQDSVVSNKQLQDAVVEKQLQDPVVSNKQLQDHIVSDKQLQDPIVSDKQLQESIVSDKQLQDPIVSDKQLQDPIVSNKQLEDPVVSNTQLQDAIVEKQLQDSVVSNKQLQDAVVEKQLQDPVVSNKQLQDHIVSDKQLQDPIVSNKQLRDPVVSNKQLRDLVSDKQLKDPVVSNKQLGDTVIEKQLFDEVGVAGMMNGVSVENDRLHPQMSLVISELSNVRDQIQRQTEVIKVLEGRYQHLSDETKTDKDRKCKRCEVLDSTKLDPTIDSGNNLTNTESRTGLHRDSNDHVLANQENGTRSTSKRSKVSSGGSCSAMTTVSKPVPSGSVKSVTKSDMRRYRGKHTPTVRVAATSDQVSDHEALHQRTYRVNEQCLTSRTVHPSANSPQWHSCCSDAYSAHLHNLYDDIRAVQDILSRDNNTQVKSERRLLLTKSKPSKRLMKRHVRETEANNPSFCSTCSSSPKNSVEGDAVYLTGNGSHRLGSPDVPGRSVTSRDCDKQSLLSVSVGFRCDDQKDSNYPSIPHTSLPSAGTSVSPLYAERNTCVVSAGTSVSALYAERYTCVVSAGTSVSPLYTERNTCMISAGTSMSPLYTAPADCVSQSNAPRYTMASFDCQQAFRDLEYCRIDIMNGSDRKSADDDVTTHCPVFNCGDNVIH